MPRTSTTVNRVIDILGGVVTSLEGQRCDNPDPKHNCPVCEVVNSVIEDVRVAQQLVATVVGR
jgi:hypothetical protein